MSALRNRNVGWFWRRARGAASRLRWRAFPKNIRLIYQPYSLKGACGLIDSGFINGFRDCGADVVIWDSEENHPDLERMLRWFRPTHFVGYLQMPSRHTAPWGKATPLGVLNAYRNGYGLKTAICSFPSNVRHLYGDWLATSPTVTSDPVVASYYTQADRPNENEKAIIESGFVDIVTARYAAQALPTGFRNFLELGIPVLSQPPAADTRHFHRSPSPAAGEGPDVVFIGNCWPFKWENMRRIVVPLKEEFGERFEIYGTGWPAGLSRGPLGKHEDVDLFADKVTRAKIALSLHEPSQVLDHATSSNERVYKLLALGCFVLSDSCLADAAQFEPNRDFVVAADGADAVKKARHFISHSADREQIARSGQETCLRYHTCRCRAKRVLDVLARHPQGVLPACGSGHETKGRAFAQ